MLVSVYFDTPDLRLLAEGISLRVRHAGTRYKQTIKITDRRAAGLFDRAEWEVDIHGPEPDLAAAKGTALTDLLNGQSTGSLRPVFETRVRRTKYHFTSHGQRIELAFDQGEIDTGKRCPAGNSRDGYELIAPLDHHGRIDATLWRAHREACGVTRFRAHEDDEIGHLVHKQGGMWAFHYDIVGEDEDETGYRFQDERFVVGEYLSVLEDDKQHTYRVVSVEHS